MTCRGIPPITLAALVCVAVFSSNTSLVAAATATATDIYPSSTVPPGVHVSFIVTGTGFSTRPTYYLTDSFPGGATTVNIDAGGNFSWTPNQDDIGAHALTVTLSDPDGTSASVSQTVTVIAAPLVTLEAPAPSSGVPVGTPISIQTTASGLFSPTYAITDSLTSSSVAGARVNAAGLFTWTPLPQDIGEHTLTFTARDTFGSSATASTDITVLPPAAVSITHLDPGTSVHASSTLSFTATCEGFVNPTIEVVDDATNATPTDMTIDGTLVSWTPAPNDYGTHRLRITARDSADRSAATTITISVLSPLPPDTPAPSPAPEAEMDSELPAATPAPVVSAPTKSTTKSVVSTPARTAPQTRTAAVTQQNVELAYPSVPAPVDAPLESTAPPIDLTPLPSLTFTQFLWNSITSFFGALFGVFRH